MKIKSIYIQEYKALRDFKIDFANQEKVNPITVLTGINGSGKTTLLDFIFETFKNFTFTENNKQSYIEIIDVERIGNFRLNEMFISNNKNNKKILSNKLLYFRAGEPNLDAKKIITNYIDELIYEQDVNSSRVYQQLADTLNEILAALNLQIQFSRLDKNKEIYFKNALSEDIKLADLSSGEKQLITKVFILFIAPIKDSIILIDEPEDSLHPDWQQEIMNLYQRLATENNNQFIIATHSPHIVSAVAQESLRLFVKSENGIIATMASTKSYGRKTEEILLNIFKVKALRPLVVEKKLAQLKKMLFDHKTNTPEFTELLSELEGLLGKYDIDLAAIRLDMLVNK